jgi:formylmethanofuran dehydrogenase subunit E
MTVAHACHAPDLGVQAAMADTLIAPYVEPLSRLHAVLCPRQVLGVRSALLAARLLQVPFPQTDKRIIALAELDGCYTDGLLVASGCSVGHRTFRVIQLGKVAVTFFDTETLTALRIWPRSDARDRAAGYAPGATSRWQAQRDGYARVPDADLLHSAAVRLSHQLQRELLEPWDTRVVCQQCGEEVFQGRQVHVGRLTLCRGCAGDGYVAPASDRRRSSAPPE